MSMKKHIKTLEDRARRQLTKSEPHSMLVIQVGEDPASTTYTNNKKKVLSELGHKIDVARVADTVDEYELLHFMDMQQRNYDGIMVQLPLPRHLRTENVLRHILPSQDVDGVNILSLHKARVNTRLPVTAQVCRDLLDLAFPKGLAGLDIAVVGRSDLVGLPLTVNLIAAGATVTSFNSKSYVEDRCLAGFDAVVLAAGVPGVVRTTQLSPNTIVIDVGISRVNGKLVGDLEYDCPNYNVNCATPVPGGVGKLTVLYTGLSLINL